MRISVMFFLFFGGIMICYGQNSKKEVLNPAALTFREIQLTTPKNAAEETKLPFSSIRIIDSRFDTSKIGFIPTVDNLIYDRHNAFRRLKFVGGVAKPLEDYYNAYYRNAFKQNGFELLIVMKRFWISGVDYTRDKRIGLSNNMELATNLYCKWEYYIGKNGQYLPARRLDTIMLVSSNDMPKDDEGEFNWRRLSRLRVLLKYVIEQFDFEKKITVFESQPKKTIEEIRNYNEKRNELIVLKDSILKRGVYLNFDEFKNNKPSITDYKEEKTRYQVFKSERYLTDLQGNLISEYWGYSDGKVFRYGKFGNDKIFRIGNTFEFFVQVINIEVNNSTPVLTKDKIKIWFPYQIDMENGLIY